MGEERFREGMGVKAQKFKDTSFDESVVEKKYIDARKSGIEGIILGKQGEAWLVFSEGVVAIYSTEELTALYWNDGRRTIIESSIGFFKPSPSGFLCDICEKPAICHIRLELFSGKDHLVSAYFCPEHTNLANIFNYFLKKLKAI